MFYIIPFPDTSGLDAKWFKMAIGVCSLFIGVAMAIGGVYYWWKNRKVTTSHNGQRFYVTINLLDYF